MNNSLKLPAPAKLNLFLHVVGQRPDGYHLIQSVFQLIDLEDTVLMRTRDDGEIVRLNPLPNVPADSDLIVRAARLLKKISGTSQGADLDLIKKIPMGAGLGGGSSDAASTLIGLNHLWKTHLNKAELAKIGLQLGADIPFFIQGENAFVEGIGEKIQGLELPERNYFLIFPHIGIPTVEIFQDPLLTRNKTSITITHFAALQKDEQLMMNDLESVAVRKYPEVKLAINWLSNNIPSALPRMSGSGSCVFTPIQDNLKIENIVAEFPNRWTKFVVRSLSQHPAYNFVSSQ